MNNNTGSPVEGRMYSITWKGEDYTIEACFLKEERGFFLFTKQEELIVCLPASIIIKEIHQ